MYYIYTGEKVEGPFSLQTIEANLNDGVWMPDLLCCEAGKKEWHTIHTLFYLKLIPPGKTPGDTARSLHQARGFIIDSLSHHPFHREGPPPKPSPENVRRIVTRKQSILMRSRYLILGGVFIIAVIKYSLIFWFLRWVAK